MRTRWLAVVALASASAALPACEAPGYEPPEAERRIELADSLYSPALFDTIQWPSEEQRATAGNLVYADFCRRCHGPVGEGGVVEVAGQQIPVPSLVAAEWRLAADTEAVRQRIFTGHVGGMPSWGISRLTPREIDAVAFYVQELLRPEMLEAPPPVDWGG